MAQAEPEADGVEETQHHDNALSQESLQDSPESKDAESSSSTVKSVVDGVVDKASEVAGSVAAATETARDSVDNAAGFLGSDPFGSSSPSTILGGVYPPNQQVYLGNLSFEVTEEQIREEFGKAGSIYKVTLIKDAKGFPKGLVPPSGSVD